MLESNTPLHLRLSGEELAYDGYGTWHLESARANRKSHLNRTDFVHNVLRSMEEIEIENNRLREIVDALRLERKVTMMMIVQEREKKFLNENELKKYKGELLKSILVIHQLKRVMQ
jgi:hypothetical protein